MDNDAVEQAARIVANAQSILTARSKLAEQFGEAYRGNRDYYKILGYEAEPEFERYRANVERGDIAATIVNFPAEETWRDAPELLDGDEKDGETDSEFVEQWNALAERLSLYHYCQRADKLTGIGRFGILLIGVNGDGDLAQPVENATADDVLYLRAYSEGSVEVKEYVTDVSDSRFGLPETYRVTMSDLTGAGNATTARLVHWSRVIHIAEGLTENEVYGAPRLKKVYNRLHDLMKIVGGSAEATWKLIRKGFVFDIDADAEMDPQVLADLQEQIDEYDHDLRRFIRTQGMTAQDLGSEVVDPSGLFEIIISLISAATGIPKRILIGSERGELASSQDAGNWAGRIAHRRSSWAEPVILNALAERFQMWGALPPPKSGRHAWKWQPLFEMSDSERADVATKWGQAIAFTARAYGQPVIAPGEWRTEFTPFSEEMEASMAMPGAPFAANAQDYTPAEIQAMVQAAAILVARGEM